MMAIGSVNGADSNMRAGYSGINMQADSVSRNIQNQIANAQKQLQELSENQNMTMEEKMKKRQEIQQEITNLNQQLRQHQMEQRKERQTKGSSMEDMLGGNQKAGTARTGSKGNGLSQAGMQAIISADVSVKQAQVQGSVATRMEGRAGVLKAEIKQSAALGGNTEAKEAELAEVEQKAMNATASQMNTLVGANRTMQEAAKAEQESKEEEVDSRTGSKADKEDGNGLKRGEPSENTMDSEDTYTPIDIRL